MVNDTLSAVVTGASRGIGFATADLFLERGWHVITCSRNKVTRKFSDERKWIGHIQADLCDREGVNKFVRSVKKHLGKNPLHALINNAGISP